jgi:hypothetical protein
MIRWLYSLVDHLTGAAAAQHSVDEIIELATALQRPREQLTREQIAASIPALFRALNSMPPVDARHWIEQRLRETEAETPRR